VTRERSGRGVASALVFAPETILVVMIVVTILVFGAIRPSFLTMPSLANLAISCAFVGIIAIGQTLLLVSGEFDLSVGAVAGLASVVGAMTIVFAGQPIWVGFAVCLGVGLFAGAFNSFCVVLLGLPSFITTIAVLFIASGLALAITNGDPVFPLPTGLTDFGSATPLGLSWMFLIFVVLGVAADFVVRRTAFGRKMLATGGDRSVAEFVGIRTGWIKVSAFVACSVLAALAGFLQTAAQFTAQPTTGTGAELTAIAAAVIGGTSVFGGSGSPLGTMLGVVFLTVATTGLVSIGLGANWQTALVGIVLISAIAVDAWRRRRRGVRTS